MKNLITTRIHLTNFLIVKIYIQAGRFSNLTLIHRTLRIVFIHVSVVVDTV